MSKKKTENEKTFSDLTHKSWFKNGDAVKVGDSMANIMNGEVQSIEVKEIFVGDEFRTWKIVIDREDKIHLLKTSRELK